MLTTQEIALWADKLRDIAAMGLLFSESVYDQERYRVVQQIAMQMTAALVGQPVEAMGSAETAVFARPTPLVGGDAAIIDEHGRILLIQRSDNRLWAMPGGALEVNETPAEGVVREALEETGVACQAVALVGIFDVRLSGALSLYHLYSIVVLCRPVGDPAGGEPSHRLEILGKAWFSEHELPAGLDPGHRLRIPEAFRVWRGGSPYFDR